MRVNQTHQNPAARVLVGSHNMEIFGARPKDRFILYIGADFFVRSSYLSHSTLGVPTLSVLAYYSNLFLLSNGTQRHLIRTLSLTDFAVR